MMVQGGPVAGDFGTPQVAGRTLYHGDSEVDLSRDESV